MENSIIYKFPFDFNYIDINKIFFKSFDFVKDKYSFLKDKKLRIINYNPICNLMCNLI